MKKYFNPSAFFYIFILLIIALLIIVGSSTSSNSYKTITVNNMTNETKIVILNTTLGSIELELYPAQTPRTVDNFLKLAGSGLYDNTKFHRVIKGFMIQGGDPYTKGEDTSVYGTGGPGYKFDDEINDSLMVRGTLAMANSGPDTNGSQFFIITATSTPWLIGNHTVFGKVISGMDVVDKIENSKINENDLPLVPVIINKVIVK